MITIIISDTFFDKEIVRFVFPHDRRKAMFGWYSRFWKKIRVEVANMQKRDKHFIRAKVVFDKLLSDRQQIIFPSGVQIDAPFDLSEVDVKIIEHHIEARRLAIS